MLHMVAQNGMTFLHGIYLTARDTSTVDLTAGLVFTGRHFAWVYCLCGHFDTAKAGCARGSPGLHTCGPEGDHMSLLGDRCGCLA